MTPNKQETFQQLSQNIETDNDCSVNISIKNKLFYNRLILYNYLFSAVDFM